MRDFLLDRLPLLLSYACAVAVLLLVIHLSSGPLSLSDVLYALLLATFFAVLILALDWQRHRRFRRALHRALTSDPFTVLPAGANREQRTMRRAFERLRSEYQDRLTRSRLEADHHRAFIDLWVHQMKTPLAVLDLSLQSSDDVEQLRVTVASETANLQDGLELMLATARLQRFDLDVHAATVNLVELAREAVNGLKGHWIRAGIYPRISGDAHLTVQTDRKWLQVVLRQLLSNAIKYSDRGQVVQVEVGREGDAVTLAVRDEGLGIPPEDLPRVFDRFFTGNNGRLRPAATGMGLHLAANICRQLGHELTASSTPGEGSTFTLVFSNRSLTAS